MPRFRKLPVVIEARQLTPENMAELMAWCGGRAWRKPPTGTVTGIAIDTLEGEMAAAYGDYIIQGVAGEFYSCRAEIFERTYEAVDDD